MTQLDKTTALVERLLRKTEAGKLKWSSGIDGETFSVDLAGGIVSVYRSYFEHDERPGVRYQVDICDEDGHPAVSQKSDFTRDFEDGPLVRLYEAARSAARNADELLDELLTSLEAA